MPSRIPDTSVFYWIHVAGLIIGLVLAVVLFRRLWRAGNGAPSQEGEGGGETPEVPVRHLLAGVLPGVALFVGVFVAYALVRFPLRAAGGGTTDEFVL